MTGGDVRALCLALPDTTEKETWGDELNAGHPTFRVRDKIFVIMAVDESGGSIKTSLGEQAELDDADDELLRGIIEGAWRRTAPKAVVKAYDEAGA